MKIRLFPPARRFHARLGDPRFRQQAWARHRVWSPGFSRQGIAVERGSKHFAILEQAASDRLKPGLRTRSAPMPHEICGLGFAAACAVSFVLAGCTVLKPSGVNPQSFILTPLPAATAPSHAGGGVGVGLVKIPGYLFKNSIAVRQGTNQIAYLEKAVWAERLDRGLQRVFAANLASLLPTDRVSLSAWRPQDVNVEVFVTIEQFDVDYNGRGVLAAWWRLLSAGHERELKAGQFRSVHTGPPPGSDPQGAAATMSELAADLSREMAEAIKAAAPGVFP